MQHTALDFLVVGCWALVMPVRSYFIGRRLASTPRSESDTLGRYWRIILRDLILAALILVDWHLTSRPWPALGLDIPVGPGGRIGFGIDGALLAVAALALTVRTKFAKKRTMSAKQLKVVEARLANARIAPQTPAEFRLFLVVAVVGSIFEELLCRGFLIWFFMPFAGLWGAVVISSVLFGINHIYQGWSGTLISGLIGLKFGIGYALTHSLWWLMLAHIMLNVVGGLRARYLTRKLKAAQPPAPESMRAARI